MKEDITMDITKINWILRDYYESVQFSWKSQDKFLKT